MNYNIVWDYSFFLYLAVIISYSWAAWFLYFRGQPLNLERLIKFVLFLIPLLLLCLHISVTHSVMAIQKITVTKNCDSSGFCVTGNPVAAYSENVPEELTSLPVWKKVVFEDSNLTPCFFKKSLSGLYFCEK